METELRRTGLSHLIIPSKSLWRPRFHNEQSESECRHRDYRVILSISWSRHNGTVLEELCDGVQSVTSFSDQELVSAGVDPALVANPNYVKAAPILPNVEMFDASFFGYSPERPRR